MLLLKAFADTIQVGLPATSVAPLWHHLGQSAGPILVTTLWQGIALATVTAFCLRLAPRTTAALRFTLWTAALLLICLLPFAATMPLPSTGARLHLDPRWSLALAAVWLTLSLLRALDLARHALRIRALSGQAHPITLDPPTTALLYAHRRAQLCTSAELERPGVIGFFRPRILIPAWLFEQLSAPELEQIVLHELEHLRRRDDWLNLIQKLALVVFPLNPALHWIDRRLCLERELACDEGVVRRTRAPRLYASCLARLAEHGLDHRVLSLALGFLERQSELARRVSGILRTSRTLSPGQSRAFVCTVAMLLLGGSVELASCPQLVSFAAAPVALASISGASSLAPETWVPRSSPARVLYTDAVAPHLLHATFTQSPKPIHRSKSHHSHRAVFAQRALVEQALPVRVPSTELLATEVAQVAPTLVTVTPLLTPTLVRYTLVHVDGGWLLLQL